MRDEIATLVEDLLAGPYEEPLWSTFLERLRQITASDYATLLIQSPRVQAEQGIWLIAGDADAEQARDTFRQFGYPDTPVRRTWAAEGVPFSLKDILARDGVEHADFFASLTGAFGIGAVREMRIQEPSGVDAWLSIVRGGQDYDETTDQLLVQLVPLLRGMLRNFVTLEQVRFESELARDAVRRLQFGWIALGSSRLILRADPFGEQVLAQSSVLARDSNGCLTIKSPQLQRELETAVAAVAAEDANKPRAIHLRSDPWLDMLIVPAKRGMFAAAGTAAAIAYVHADNWSARDRESQLAELFSLTSSEAKLVLALCRGKNIAEAAGEIGLTVQSARTYSKSIFAKIGARGQPDLVRIIMGSILAMAPDG